MKKKLLFGTMIIIIAAIVLWATIYKNGKDGDLTYETKIIDRGDIEALVDTTGTLNPVTIVDVGSQVSGRIQALNADFNSKVKAGQIIAKLDPELFITKVNQNKANYDSAAASVAKAKVELLNSERQYQRALSLFNKDLLSFEEKESSETKYYSAKADLQSAESKLKQAESQLKSSEVDLAYTIIKSPIDGVVISRNINAGQTVAASFQAPVLFQIANDLTKMQVECSVDEADIGQVKEGQQVKFTVDAFPEQRFSGVVSQVRYAPEVVQNVVTYTTIVEVENPELKLRPGMTATVSIVVGQAKNVLRVPNSALRFTPELSQEEMRALFEKMRAERQAQRGGQPGTGPRQQGGPGGQNSGAASGGSQRTTPPRVWTRDADGQLKMIFMKTGVTDNVYTEILRSSLELEEGQELLTGTNGGDSTQSPGPPRGMGMGMGFMRR